MNFDILRQKILEKAIRGELVPQLENEPEVAQIGDASEAVPFVLPQRWKWMKLSNLGKLSTGSTPKTSDKSLYGGSFPFIKPSEITESGDLILKPSLSESGKNTTRVVKTGSVLMVCIGATIGKTAIAQTDVAFNQQINAIEPNFDIVDSKFLHYIFRSNWLQTNIKNSSSATTLPIINKRKWGDLFIPLPPIEEQRRIIAKLNQLFEQINRAERAYNELSGPLSERFRQLCLEKAIQGKLVPQLESEPAVEQIGKAPELSLIHI